MDEIKSRVTQSFLHVMRALLQDVLAAYPLIRGLTLDYERITRICLTRGSSAVMLDLPHLDSLLLQGLETGRLSLEGPLSSAVSKRIRVPKLFSGLWLRVFHMDGSLLPDPDVNSVLFLRQLTRLGKNLEVECSYDRKRAALETYYDIERSLRVPNSTWDSDSLHGFVQDNGQQLLTVADCHRPRGVGDLFWREYQNVESERYRVLQRVQLVADIVIGALGSFDPVAYSGWLEMRSEGTGFKHGPGAVSERLKQWEKSNWLNWPKKLDGFFPFEDCGNTACSGTSQPRNHEPPARLLFVPKTAKSPRIIACEPTSHMWCQQLIWRWLEDRLRGIFGDSFVAFRRQDLSARMVLQASRDRELCTVDLSSASDRLSCWTVERVFRSNTSVLQALHAARTRWLRVDMLGIKDDLKLRKFASQGTATTFPVQSIVYLVVALASAMPTGSITMGRIMRLKNRVRVYGDDIILPTHGYSRLVASLEDLQLKVNGAKSFVNGHFRESCGSDAFLGVCVTPCCPTTLVANGPKSYQAIVDVSKNLHLKGFWNASAAMVELLPRRISSRLRIVSVYDKGISGLVSFTGSDERHLEQRWNSQLCRLEVKTWSLHSNGLTSTRCDSHLTLDFFSRPRSTQGWGLKSPPRVVSEYVMNREVKMRLKWVASMDENVTTVHAA